MAPWTSTRSSKDRLAADRALGTKKSRATMSESAWKRQPRSEGFAKLSANATFPPAMLRSSPLYRGCSPGKVGGLGYHGKSRGAGKSRRRVRLGGQHPLRVIGDRPVS